MEIIFLGTSSGTPTKERNVSATAIKYTEGKEWVLVDCGEATQHQLLQTKLSLNSLQAICITHIHGDHCYGLPGLLASAAMGGRTHPLVIFCPPQVKKMLEAIQEHTELYLPYPIDYIDTQDMVPYQIGNLSIESCLLSHRVMSHGFAFTYTKSKNLLLIEKLKEDAIPASPVWGQIQKGIDCQTEDGKTILADNYLQKTISKERIIVGGDNDSPELLSDFAKSADVIVHEATYSEAMLQKVGAGPQHCSAKRIAKFAQKTGVKNLVLTHFSARYQMADNANTSINELRMEAELEYQGNLMLAQDFDVYALKNGELTKQK